MLLQIVCVPVTIFLPAYAISGCAFLCVSVVKIAFVGDQSPALVDCGIFTFALLS